MCERNFDRIHGDFGGYVLALRDCGNQAAAQTKKNRFNVRLIHFERIPLLHRADSLSSFKSDLQYRRSYYSIFMRLILVFRS
jgi:hypothetical protein